MGNSTAGEGSVGRGGDVKVDGDEGGVPAARVRLKVKVR